MELIQMSNVDLVTGLVSARPSILNNSERYSLNMRTLWLYFFRFVGFFFLLMTFMQFQDGFIGYAFVSLGIAALVLYFSFRELVRSRQTLS